MKSKTLPSTVTHLDIIKTIAVIIMIIDHVGMYFFPDITWFRVVGRIGMPVWFFMVGYSKSRDLPNILLIGALILAAADFILFQKIFAMNALITIIALRFIIDHVMEFVLRSRYLFILAYILMALFYFATNMMVEYGSLALMFAVLGYLARNKEKVIELTFFTNRDYVTFWAFVLIAFCLFQNASFGFDDIQFAFMAVLTAGCMVILSNMKPMVFPKITNKITCSILQLGGRRTLEIYVIHLLAFKLILFTVFVLGLNG